MRISILGSTGSIGRNTVQVIRELEEPAVVTALTAGRNVDALVDQALELKPQILSVADSQTRDALWKRLRGGANGYRPEVLSGPEGNLAAVTEVNPDTVVSAAVGVFGLEATFEAVKLGKRVALANKETLVAAGELVMAEAAKSGAELLPVDSEHNGMHQCLRAGRRDEVDRLILTASGGPFRETPTEELANVTPEQALNHPTWKMGERITIDSSTLMNKGFEVIEACWLFDFPVDKVDVVVHPESIVHAMVEYRDGSVVAQLCPPDMKLPIRYALTYPAREVGLADRRLKWDRVRQLSFEAPDVGKFPLLRSAYQAAEAKGTAGCILNAADEIAVSAFLDGRIPYLGIAETVNRTLNAMPASNARSIAETMETDRQARRVAADFVARSFARRSK